MQRRGTRAGAQQALPWLLLLYGAMSLLHFVHNAAYLPDYPNLPPGLTRAQVYLSWCGLTGLGVAGYGLYRRAFARAGLLLLALYALLGFDALLHYRRAPFAAHTAMMNFSIWAEVAAAALLLTCIARLLLFGRHSQPTASLKTRGGAGA